MTKKKLDVSEAKADRAVSRAAAKKVFKKPGKIGLSPELQADMDAEAERRCKAREHHQPTDHAAALAGAANLIQGLPNTPAANVAACYLEAMEFLKDPEQDCTGMGHFEDWRAKRVQNVHNDQKDPAK